MRIKTLIIFLVLCTYIAAAQESENPDIFLPPVVLEVEDSGSQSVSLPDPEIPEQSPGLPGVLVDAEDPADPLSGMIHIPVIDPLSAGEIVSDRTFFGEGTIGVGSGNRLYGNIELTQLGTDGPGFSAGFLHDSSDGFYPNDPGQGFFSREDNLYGSFVYLGDRIQITAEGDFLEDAFGLQERSTYYDVTNRSAMGGAGATYTNNWFTAAASADFQYISQVFGATTPVNQQYARVDPALSVGGSWDLASVSLFTKGRLGEDSVWEGGGSLEFTPTPWLTIDGGVSAFGSGPYFPWYAGIELGYFTGVTAKISGGADVEITEPGTLLETAPMSPLLTAYPYSVYNYIQADLMFAAANNLSFTGTSRIYWDREKYWFDSSLNPDGLLPFRQSPYDVSFGGAHRLALRYSKDLDWYISGGYEFDHSGEDFLGERNHMVFDAEYTFPGTNIVFAGAFELDLSGSEGPLFNVSAEIPATEHVSFELSGNDLMGAAREEGRSYIGDYTRKGFEISLFTKISL